VVDSVPQGQKHCVHENFSILRPIINSSVSLGNGATN